MTLARSTVRAVRPGGTPAVWPRRAEARCPNGVRAGMLRINDGPRSWRVAGCVTCAGARVRPQRSPHRSSPCLTTMSLSSGPPGRLRGRYPGRATGTKVGHRRPSGTGRGVCLNVGCVPSKALPRNAEIADLLRAGGKDFGFEVQGLTSISPSRSAQPPGVRPAGGGLGFQRRRAAIDVHMGRRSSPKSAHDRGVRGKDGTEDGLKGKDIVWRRAPRREHPRRHSDGDGGVTYREAILQAGGWPKSVV